VTDPAVRTEYYDAGGTLKLREPLMALYLRSHLDQQDNPWYSPGQFWDRLVRLYAPGRDFGLVAAWRNEVMVGYAFGSPSDKAHEVWEMASVALTDLGVPSTPEPIYVFREFAVDPDYQGEGYGRLLHDALLRTRPERLAYLLVRPDNTAARLAYQSWGWQKVGQTQPFPDAPVMDVMVRVLKMYPRS